MTIWFGTSCLLGLPCVSFVKIYQFESVFFPFGFEVGMLNLVI